MPYDINDHCHRLAAWAASTSASASPLCRFNVETGVKILEDSGFVSSFNLNSLPSPTDLDRKHKAWRESVIEKSKKHAKVQKKGSPTTKEMLNFSHGIAAKLINCYLKVRFVCGGHHDNEKVQALHPPIDAVLLKELADMNYAGKKMEWRGFWQKRWSKFDSNDYEAVIKLIRASLPQGKPLWSIEEHWGGHQ